MKMSKEVNAVMFFDELRNVSYETKTSTDASHSVTYLLKFCIIGDSKEAFQLAGRSEFDSFY